MLDRILISGLTCDAVIGVSDRERGQKQALEMDIELAIPTDRRTEIGDAADYREIVRTARDVIEREDRRLLEHLAEDVALELKKRFGPDHVRIRVHKPRIAAKYGVSSIGVEVIR